MMRANCGTSDVDPVGVVDSSMEASGADAHVRPDTGAGARGDVSALEADTSHPNDASSAEEASAPDAAIDDASSADAGPVKCNEPFKPDYAFCDAAMSIGLNTPLTMQDTAQGARGDCGFHGSGFGGRNLYYRVRAPAGLNSLVIATPTRAGEDALVRVLTNCVAAEAETGARGFSQGIATVCINNWRGVEREVVIAVARYSGEIHDATLAFELTVTPLAQGINCPL